MRVLRLLADLPLVSPRDTRIAASENEFYSVCCDYWRENVGVFVPNKHF